MSKKRRNKPRPAAARATARLTSPGQIAAAVPHMLGFVPHESLVVLCGHEPRGRLGLRFRLDLPGPDVAAREALADQVAQLVDSDAPTRFSLLVFTEQEGDFPEAELVDAVCDRLVGYREMEVLLVRGGRWSSYHCALPCCPVEGTPVADDEDSSPISLVRAENVLSGRVVAPSRQALEATLAGPVLLAAVAAGQRCDAARLFLEDAVADGGRAATNVLLVDRWEAALERFTDPPAVLDPDEAALLAVGLESGYVRDRLSGCDDDERPVALRVLAELMRLTPAPYDGLVAAQFGWLTYVEGSGAEVTIALERAKASAPDHLLTELLELALTRAVPPREVRAMLRGAYGRAYGGRGLTA